MRCGFKMLALASAGAVELVESELGSGLGLVRRVGAYAGCDSFCI
jgi:hypothetical protein